MTSLPARSGAVVVGVDGSDPANLALDWAATTAALEHLPLTIIHAVAPMAAETSLWVGTGAIPTPEMVTAVEQAGAALLVEAATRAEWREPELEIRTRRHLADPRNVLIRASEDAGLVVVGSRGRGPLASMLLGSVGMAVVGHAGSPVAVVRAPGPGIERRGVLVGTDATERSAVTVEEAFRQASLRRRPVTVGYCGYDAEVAVHGWTLLSEDAPDAQDLQLRVAETIAGLREKFPDVPVDVVIAHGHPGRFLVEQAATRELLVVGHHGHSLLDSWGLGSLATVVIEYAATTVLTVP
jgi:nucleotide-binding universal stress UspA family protein